MDPDFMIHFTWLWLKQKVWGFLPVLAFLIFTWKNGRLWCGTRCEMLLRVPCFGTWSLHLLLLPNICSHCSCPGCVCSSPHCQGDILAHVAAGKRRGADVWVQPSQKWIRPIPSQNKIESSHQDGLLFSPRRLCTWQTKNKTTPN